MEFLGVEVVELDPEYLFRGWPGTFVACVALTVLNILMLVDIIVNGNV